MKPETSLYVDVIRIGAVLLVFINHAKRTAFTDGFLDRFGVYGQEAVAIFFVLSGLVISHVTLTRPGSLRAYSVARLARLWSVVVPAVLLTVVLDCLGVVMAPALYRGADLPGWGFDIGSVWQAVSPVLFLNSVPPLDVDVGSNGPFWSLSYEAWYYAGFGFAVFLAGWKRILVLGLLVVLAGPNIRMLAPIWLLGVIVQRRLGTGGPSGAAWVGWIGSIVGMMVLLGLKYRLMPLVEPVVPYLAVAGVTSDVIVEKYGSAIMVAINIVCFDRIAGRLSALVRMVERPVRAIASRSFSIYLYQAPLLFFLGSVCQDVTGRGARIAIFYGVTLAVCLLVAEFTEQRKHVLVRWLNALLGSFKTGGGGAAPRAVAPTLKH